MSVMKAEFTSSEESISGRYDEEESPFDYKTISRRASKVTEFSEL